MLKKMAPAKINLFLHVLGRRADGYHDIISLLQKISLYDELTFLPRPQGILLHCPGSDLPTNQDNLIFRAAADILSFSGYPAGVEISLVKKIPQAAGLGGGSSDAATTLMALNEMFALGLKKAELMKLGAKLGADVPFFISGNAALASETGTKLKTVKNLPLLNLVLIKPPFSLSTKSVYENLNLALTKKVINYSIPRFFSISEIIRAMHNDLENVSIKMHPELADWKKVLVGHGALGAMMSGSGPTVFGIFTDEITAKKAAMKLAKGAARRCAIFVANSL